MDGNRIVSAGKDGIVKIFEVNRRTLKQIFDSYNDVTSVASSDSTTSKLDSQHDRFSNLPLKTIRCLTAFKDMVFWGDDGYNIKALHVKTGELLITGHLFS